MNRYFITQILSMSCKTTDSVNMTMKCLTTYLAFSCKYINSRGFNPPSNLTPFHLPSLNLPSISAPVIVVADHDKQR